MDRIEWLIHLVIHHRVEVDFSWFYQLISIHFFNVEISKNPRIQIFLNAHNLTFSVSSMSLLSYRRFCCRRCRCRYWHSEFIPVWIAYFLIEQKIVLSFIRTKRILLILVWISFRPIMFRLWPRIWTFFWAGRTNDKSN